MKSVDIKIELLRLKITEKEIAESVDPPVTQPAISQIISGKRNTPRLQEAVAAAIGKTADEVFPIEKDPKDRRKAERRKGKERRAA